MNVKTKICSVILNYNDAETTEQLVRLIHEYDVPEEIVVVDNASTDDSWDQLKGLEDQKVHVIRAEKNEREIILVFAMRSSTVRQPMC